MKSIALDISKACLFNTFQSKRLRGDQARCHPLEERFEVYRRIARDMKV
jgi:hypothetical protein